MPTCFININILIYWICIMLLRCILILSFRQTVHLSFYRRCRSITRRGDELREFTYVYATICQPTMLEQNNGYCYATRLFAFWFDNGFALFSFISANTKAPGNPCSPTSTWNVTMWNSSFAAVWLRATIRPFWKLTFTLVGWIDTSHEWI